MSLIQNAFRSPQTSPSNFSAPISRTNSTYTLQAKDEEEQSEEEPTQRTQRHRRAPAEAESEDENDVEEEVDGMEVDGDQADSPDQVVKKLVRYALACEYQRVVIKRGNITEKGQ